MALHLLSKNYLRDKTFVDAWLQRGGLKVLVEAMLKTSGSTQALTLRCLVSAIEQTDKTQLNSSKALDFTPDVFAVVLELCTSPTIATQKSALQLAAIVASNGSLLTFQEIEAAAAKAVERVNQGAADGGGLKNGWEILVKKGLFSDDVDCARYALEILNSVALASGSMQDFFAQLDEECGLLKAINARCLFVASFRDALVAQQRARLQHIENDRTTNFDAQNPKHVGMLKEMWGFVFPDEPYPGDKGPHWEQLGFQGKDPSSDLRGAGLMGLANLHYMAETYPEVLRKICAEQAGKTVDEPYYPVATAGINVSHLLHEKLYKSPEVLPFIFDQSYAFEEIYCATMKLVDATFHKVHSTYMEFTAKVVPAVKAHLDKVLATKPQTVDVIRELLLESDEQELQQRLEAAMRSAARQGIPGAAMQQGPSLAGSGEEVFVLKASSEDTKKTLAFVKQMTTAFVRRCKIDHLKKGCTIRWLRVNSNSMTSQGRSKAQMPSQFLLSSDLLFIRLAMNEQGLEWGVAKVAGVTPPLPNTIALASFGDLAFGGSCPLFKTASTSKAKDTTMEECRDRCLELLPPTLPPDGSGGLSMSRSNITMTDASAATCFVFEDASMFPIWVDGLKALFQKPLLMAEDDIKALVAAQMTKRALDLEGVDFDPHTPPQPPANKPVNYNFTKK